MSIVTLPRIINLVRLCWLCCQLESYASNDVIMWGFGHYGLPLELGAWLNL